jgi:hypothetical protein
MVKQFARAGGVDVIEKLLRTLSCEGGVLGGLRGGVGEGPEACRQQGDSWGMACRCGERLWERVAGRYTLKKCGNIQVQFPRLARPFYRAVRRS